MALEAETKAKILMVILQASLVEEMGDETLSDNDAVEFVAEIVKCSKTLPKESEVSLSDIFDIHREILPISSRPVFDRAVKKFEEPTRVDLPASALATS